MAVGRPDRVEGILVQGFVVLGGGLQGVRLSEKAAGVLRDICVGIVEEEADHWTPVVADTVWSVIYDVGVAARAGHTQPHELGVDDLIAAIWKVIRSRMSLICLKLKQRLTSLGYPQPPELA